MEENPYLKYFKNGCTDQTVDDAINASLWKINRIVEIEAIIYQIKIGVHLIEAPKFYNLFVDDTITALSYALLCHHDQWKNASIKIDNPNQSFIL